MLAKGYRFHLVALGKLSNNHGIRTELKHALRAEVLYEALYGFDHCDGLDSHAGSIIRKIRGSLRDAQKGSSIPG